MTDTIPLHKSDCALLIGGYQCTCGFRQRQNKTPPALAAEPTKPEPVGWHYQNSAGYSIVHWRPSARLDADMQAAKDYPNTHKVTPLYAAPPEDEALRRDAERYRWLRDNAAGFSGRTLDAVTDAALRREDV